MDTRKVQKHVYIKNHIHEFRKEKKEFMKGTKGGDD